MKIVFDQGVPAPLRKHLPEHAVDTTYERGWSQLENGELLAAAEQDAYELLITTDQKLKHQQNLSGRQLAILVLLSTSWPRIQLKIDDIRAAITRVRPGSYEEIAI